MTLVDKNIINIKNFRKEYFYEKIIIFLFSFLPISLILGNTAINLNIIIIDVLFLLICIFQKKWSWLKNKYVYFLILFWLYLIINSVFLSNQIINGIDAITDKNVFPQKESITRSIGFLRFVIFVFAAQYFFVNLKKNLDKVFFYWSIIIFVVLADVIFEKIFGFNTLGNVSDSPKRIVSFFGDELIVGSFLLGFSFITSGFLLNLNKNNSKKKLLSIIFFILSIICIYLSGERSNFIKAIFVSSLIIILINNSYLYLNKKYIFLLIFLGIAILSLVSKDIYERQLQGFKILIAVQQGKVKEETKYLGLGYKKQFAHYETAWNMFKDYKVTGVGNRKFRYVCHDEKYFNPSIKMTYIRCSNHPHQIHLEILSEQGIIGYLLIILIIFSVLFDGLKVYRRTKNIIHLTSILFIISFLIPLLPSGSFFSTFYASLFWINFSIAFAYLKINNS